jgi:hypothetical protein
VSPARRSPVRLVVAAAALALGADALVVAFVPPRDSDVWSHPRVGERSAAHQVAPPPPGSAP